MTTLYETALDIVEAKTAMKYDGWLIDLQTAGAIVTVYAALSSKHKARFQDVVEDKGVARVVDFVWSAVS